MTGIDCGGITIITFTGEIAEIVIDSALKPPISAAELVRLLIANDVFTAKIVRTTQTAKEGPLSAVCDPTGEQAVTS